ncbi:hypothetical protein AB2450_003508 [Salmonella enterica]
MLTLNRQTWSATPREVQAERDRLLLRDEVVCQQTRNEHLSAQLQKRRDEVKTLRNSEKVLQRGCRREAAKILRSTFLDNFLFNLEAALGCVRASVPITISRTDLVLNIGKKATYKLPMKHDNSVSDQQNSSKGHQHFKEVFI